MKRNRSNASWFLRGFGTLHAPFLTERRTRGLLLRCVAGNPGSGPRVLAEDSAWCSFFALHPLRKRSSPEADGREAALETIRVMRNKLLSVTENQLRDDRGDAPRKLVLPWAKESSLERVESHFCQRRPASCLP